MPSIIESVASRSFGGISLASKYISDANRFLQDPSAAYDLDGSAWAKELEDASKRLIYDDNTLHIGKFKEASSGDPPGTILKFDATITTTRRDRDGDTLRTRGAKPDTAMPLLWQHMSQMPIGKMTRIIHHTGAKLVGEFIIADTALGRDAAVLVRMGALRISHGFNPLVYEPIEDKDGNQTGWDIKEFEIFETSVVSVPSNIDAVIHAAEGKCHHTAVKSFLAMRKQVCAAAEPVVKEMCGCQAKESKVNVQKALEQRLEAQKKDFEIDAQELTPGSELYGMVKKFLGCDIKDIHQQTAFAPNFRMGSFLTSLRECFDELQTVSVRNIHHDGSEVPPRYATVQLNSVNSKEFLLSGIEFRKGEPRETKISLVISYSKHWYGIDVDFYVQRGKHGYVQEQLAKAWELTYGKNNFLKGEAFSLSGDFIPKTAETWEDVFLEPVNQEPLSRACEVINAKGHAAASRGILAVGPPGCGKTLSGRVIRNTVKSSFIWVSSRDFWTSGSFGGFAEAFELAKELSPCVLFVEDIDNWLDKHSIDLLKTEMDGIGRHSGILTILTTNFPESIPEALIDRPGRFHDVLRLDLPSDDVRGKMLAKWLPELPEAHRTKLVKETEGMSGAHLYELAGFAKTIAEQDEVELAVAVDKALAKIKEQRELITEIQSSGSHYRPGHRQAEAIAKAAAFRERPEVPSPIAVRPTIKNLIRQLLDQAYDEPAEVLKSLEAAVELCRILDHNKNLTQAMQTIGIPIPGLVA